MVAVFALFAFPGLLFLISEKKLTRSVADTSPPSISPSPLPGQEKQVTPGLNGLAVLVGFASLS